MNGKLLTAALCTAVVTAACESERMDQDELMQEVETDTEYSRSLDDIVDEPSGNTGQTVAVRGDIEKTITNGFMLEEKGLGQDKLLVITDGTESYEKGQRVMVEGTVHNALLSTIERDYDLEGFASGELEIDVETEPLPYVMATQVEAVD